MKNDQNASPVGDTASPALKPSSAGLRNAVDSAERMPGQTAPKVRVVSTSEATARAVSAAASAPQNCEQKVWMTFFFDGTGNNRYADFGTRKHSNVARLYLVHTPDNTTTGVYRIYIPGVGTYFKEVGDDGGGTASLGAGYKGDARLAWALMQFDDKLKTHLAAASKSVKNKIIEINIAIYGFSRGAALARAFSNDLIKHRTRPDTRGLALKNTEIPLRIRFMGLFDTVASVGLPMSANNSSIRGTFIGAKLAISDRLTGPSFRDTLPSVLAFAEGGRPGADPAAGTFDGHAEWGGRLVIQPVVEDVRHFIAAHEIRNSFPVDSISVLNKGKVIKPEHFFEYIFPGVHSDIGGSYRTGEGGRSEKFDEKLGLITLNQMYELSIAKEVPLLPKGAWVDSQKEDFSISKKLLEIYNYYQDKVVKSTSAGLLINSHMSLYYGWRFRDIHIKQQGNHSSADEVAKYSNKFKAEQTALDSEIAPLTRNDQAAAIALQEAEDNRRDFIQSNYGNGNINLSEYDTAVKTAKLRREKTRDALLKATAQRDALPNMREMNAMIELYDKQLMLDAKAIRVSYTQHGTDGKFSASRKRENLRPHYKVMMDAYENEFIYAKGLEDETIIAFFDHYVHDSLSGFAKDATLPSDPRVVYWGGDQKYEYAQVEKKGQDVEPQYAFEDDAMSDERVADV